MFSQERMGPYLAALANQVESVSRSALAKERSGTQLAKLGQFLSDRISVEQSSTYDRYAKLAAEKGLPMLACQKGCSWCCNQRVGATIPEALAVAAFVEANFDETQKSELRERIAAYQAGLLAWQKATPYNEACAFLKDGACSIFASRPAACRAFNSNDASICRHNYEHPEDLQPKRTWEVHWDIAYEMRQALERALQSQGLDGSKFEFVSVMGTIFDNPELIGDYMKGERPFADSQLP